MFDSQYIRDEALKGLFASVGTDVAIADTCTIVGRQYIQIGSHVRIDGYCTIIAGPEPLVISDYIHIGAYCMLGGGEGICLGDFVNLSQGVRIYSRSTDFAGKGMAGVTIPQECKDTVKGCVTIRRHALIGSGAVILPGVVCGEGAAVGALSLVKHDLEPWGIHCGIPAKRIRNRHKDLLRHEAYIREREGLN